MRALLLLVALAGCSDIPQARTKQEIRDIAREEMASVSRAVDHNAIVANEKADQVRDLERRVENLEQANRDSRAEVDNHRRQLLLIR